MKINVLFLLLFSLAAQSLRAQATPPIIPLPGSYQEVTGSFLLDSKTTVYINDPSFSDEALFLQKILFDMKRLPLSIQSQPGSRSISLLKENRAGNNKEGYSLKMSPKGVTLSAGDKEGIFRGITSLLHLISASEDNSISCWNIEDAPRYEWRGFMLDESRHFFGKEKVKQLLDWMAFYKLNRFHWHLTDDPGWRIEIKKYPLLGYIGGIGNHSDGDAAPQFYTQEEIREIVQYAAERKIVVIPEIDMPGHARAANRAYPQFSGGGSERYPEFTFDPGNEGTYQYLTDILKEVNVLFPSEMIHLGGDEVHFGNEAWNHNEGIKTLMAKHNLKDLPQVEKYFMVRMADSLFAMNNKILAWDEMADISLPSEKTLIFWWRHDQPAQLEKALEKDYKVVLCPRIPYYFDFVQDSTHAVGRRWSGDFADLKKAYSFTPEKWVKGSRLEQVVGMQANLWTEVIATPARFEFMTFPRITALSEAAWGQNNDYDDYLERLKLQIPLYEKEDLYFFNPFNVSQTPEPKR